MCYKWNIGAHKQHLFNTNKIITTYTEEDAILQNIFYWEKKLQTPKKHLYVTNKCWGKKKLLSGYF